MFATKVFPKLKPYLRLRLWRLPLIGKEQLRIEIGEGNVNVKLSKMLFFPASFSAPMAKYCNLQLMSFTQVEQKH